MQKLGGTKEMKELQCRNITLNNKHPKVCVPITGKTVDEIIEQAKAVKALSPDLVEWRGDYYQIENEENDTFEIIHTLENIHKVLNEIPIIFTFRTAAEGGERQINIEKYKNFCSSVADESEKNNVAFIDVEAYGKRNVADIKELINYIHEQGVKVIGSNHHFHKTPSEKEMLRIMTAMEKMGTDVCKLAVMPKEKEDVNVLIKASQKADAKIKAPVVTMSMGELGAVTRVCPSLTKSVMTFAAGTNASAPGQIDCDIVKKLLQINGGCTMERNIALIGFMGTGKTTISKALSRITGFKEVDVDQYIVQKAGMEIKDIFDKYGEQHFRNLETKALKELQSRKGQIISCGGGAVLRDENVEILKQGGVIVLLTATPETIFDRVKDHTHRPILNSDMSIEHVTELMNAREPRYQEVADIKVGVDSNDRVLTCYELLSKLEAAGHLKINS